MFRSSSLCRRRKNWFRFSPRKGILNIDVLSFNRLAYRVFEEVGGNTRPILEETGKSLVLQKVVGDRQKELKVLGRDVEKIRVYSPDEIAGF